MNGCEFVGSSHKSSGSDVSTIGCSQGWDPGVETCVSGACQLCKISQQLWTAGKFYALNLWKIPRNTYLLFAKLLKCIYVMYFSSQRGALKNTKDTNIFEWHLWTWTQVDRVSV